LQFSANGAKRIRTQRQAIVKRFVAAAIPRPRGAPRHAARDDRARREFRSGRRGRSEVGGNEVIP